MMRIPLRLAGLFLGVALPALAAAECPEGTYHADTRIEGNKERVICKCLPGRTLVDGQCVLPASGAASSSLPKDSGVVGSILHGIPNPAFLEWVDRTVTITRESRGTLDFSAGV